MKSFLLEGLVHRHIFESDTGSTTLQGNSNKSFLRGDYFSEVRS